MGRWHRQVSLLVLFSYGALQGCSYQITQPILADPSTSPDAPVDLSEPVLIVGYMTEPGVYHDWRGRVAECGADSLCFQAKTVYRPSGVIEGERFALAESDLASITVPKIHLWRSMFVGLVGLAAFTFIIVLASVGMTYGN